jgi:hypothetical protein
MMAARSVERNMYKTIFLKKPLKVEVTPIRECFHFKINNISDHRGYLIFGALLGRPNAANRLHRTYIGSQKRNYGLNDTGYGWRSNGYADFLNINPRFFGKNGAPHDRLFAKGDQISVLVDVRKGAEEGTGEIDLGFFKNGEYLCSPFQGITFPETLKIYIGCSMYKVDDEVSVVPSTRVFEKEDIAIV